MEILNINCSSFESIQASFDRIADKFFSDLQLQINNSYYRLLDIEFYYFAKGVHEDIYAHKHEAQLSSGRWYFHGSGIDITLGDGINHGGILIRAIGKISGDASKERKFIGKEIHGPLNVKTEICSNLAGVFENKQNTFTFHDVSVDRMTAMMEPCGRIIKTQRIGLNPANDKEEVFYPAKLRYVIFPHLKLKDKTRIAIDMHEQFPNLRKEEINKELGSTFLK